MPRLVLLSDTHGFHRKLRVPDGDILVHTGDFCTSGKEVQAQDFARWLLKMPHAHKVVIAGNHDRCLEIDITLGHKLLEGATYLLDQETTILGLRFYGSPWQPEFLSWAFNLPRGQALREVWQKIPSRIDVLLTHGPPHGILDETSSTSRVGCEDLLAELSRVRPRLHVFGHIHEARGAIVRDDTLYVNASICTLGYDPRHPIYVVDLPEGGGPASVVREAPPLG